MIDGYIIGGIAVALPTSLIRLILNVDAISMACGKIVAPVE
ncbi:MAG: hypothetical protein JWP81_4049 [Ferruginibacter sp.]|nr:hypothetical protein [Ferruginibacter sp.]